MTLVSRFFTVNQTYSAKFSLIQKTNDSHKPVTFSDLKSIQCDKCSLIHKQMTLNMTNVVLVIKWMNQLFLENQKHTA